MARLTKYEDLPERERQLAESGGMGKPNSYVRAPDDPPYYPPAVLELLRDQAEIVLGGADDADDSIEGTQPTGHTNGNGNGAGSKAPSGGLGQSSSS